MSGKEAYEVLDRAMGYLHWNDDAPDELRKKMITAMEVIELAMRYGR